MFEPLYLSSFDAAWSLIEVHVGDFHIVSFVGVVVLEVKRRRDDTHCRKDS